MLQIDVVVTIIACVVAQGFLFAMAWVKVERSLATVRANMPAELTGRLASLEARQDDHAEFRRDINKLFKIITRVDKQLFVLLVRAVGEEQAKEILKEGDVT